MVAGDGDDGDDDDGDGDDGGDGWDGGVIEGRCRYQQQQQK